MGNTQNVHNLDVVENRNSIKELHEISSSVDAEELTMQGITTFDVHKESTTFTVVLVFAILTILYCCKLSLGNWQMFQSCKSSRPVLPQYHACPVDTHAATSKPSSPTLRTPSMRIRVGARAHGGTLQL